MTNMENKLPKIDSIKSNKAKQESMSLISRASVIRRLRKGKEKRDRFVSSHVDKTIAYQLRALRDRQKLSQDELVEIVGMNQNAISRLESPRYGRPTITTLKRLASAFNVALVVRFVPFSQLIDWVTGTPFVDKGLSLTSLASPDFAEEEELGRFEEPEATDIPSYEWVNEATVGAPKQVPPDFLWPKSPTGSNQQTMAGTEWKPVSTDIYKQAGEPKHATVSSNPG